MVVFSDIFKNCNVLCVCFVSIIYLGQIVKSLFPKEVVLNLLWCPWAVL